MGSFSLIYVLSEWVIRIAMIPVVARRRTPSAALAWLGMIFALPWPGLIAYGLVGHRWLGRQRARRHAQVVRDIQTVDRHAVTQPHVTRPHIDEQRKPVVNLAMSMGGMPILGGNGIELIADTNELVNRLIADIDAAQHHVHLLFYIWRDDATGRRVAEALARAEKRNVQCRVLVDHAGSRRHIGTLPRFFAEHQIDYHPLLPVSPLRRRFQRMDLRNHRKLAVIDSRIAYTGSQNIVNPDYGHKDLAWIDLGARVTGPGVLHLQLVYLEDWYSATDQVLDSPDILPPPQTTGEVPIQVVPSGPNYPTETLENLVVEAIHTAHRRLIITTPYFVPDEPSLLALKMAVMRGAQVDIVVPARGDHPIVQAAGRAYYGELLEAGVNIHRFTRGLLHAKTITVDDAFAMIGSANFDVRSFYLNFELNLMLYGPQVTAQLRFLQQHYIEQSQRIDPGQWKQRPRRREILDDAAKLLSPLL